MTTGKEGSEKMTEMQEMQEIHRRAHAVLVLNAILDEIQRQDSVNEEGYPATRHGVRLGLANAEDELREAYDNWKLYKLSGNYDPVAAELVQCAAVIVRTIREIRNG